MLLKDKIGGTPGAKIVGWGFVIWGIHKADYPFLRDVIWFAPWGFFLASAIFLFVAIGMLLVYYEKIRFELTEAVREKEKATGNAKETERKLLTLLDNLQGMAYRCLNDQNWTMLFLSEGCYELTGYPPEALTGPKAIPYNDLIHPEDNESVWSAVQKALEGSLPFKISYRIRTSKGEEKWVYEQGLGVSHTKGGIQVLEGFITDITAMEMAKKDLTEKLHLLTLSSEIGTCLSSGEGIGETLEECCHSMVNHLDVALAGIWLAGAGDRFMELKACAGFSNSISDKYSRIPMDGNLLGHIASKKTPYHTNSLLKDSILENKKWALENKLVSFAGYPLMAGDKPVGIMGLFARHEIMNGVTRSLSAVADIIAMGVERKSYEEALASSESHFRTLFNTIPDLVWLKDPDGFYLACNRKFEKLFGADLAHIIGKTDYDFVNKKLADLFRQNDLAAMKAGVSCINEEEVVYADDGHWEKLETVKTPMIDSRGKIVGVLGIARDITERERAAQEKESLEKQLRQAQKMEAIGTLAGGIAHDFNNILSAIYGYSELAMDDIKNPEVLRQDIYEIQKGAERARNLVRQILTFSRKTEHEKKPLNISLITKEALKLLRSSIPTTIEIREEITSNALTLADPTQIHQIVMNLCTNAYQAMKETGGRLCVALREVEKKQWERPRPGLLPGKYIRLEVSDTGIGMDEETMGKIFEPYFTTKEPGEGTGLGLAVAHGVVESHGGAIEVKSEPGEGTTFHVYFPVYDAEGEDAPLDREKPLVGGNEIIMFVDDDTKIIKMTHQILSRYGYKISSFNNGIPAYEAFKKDPDKYDLLITDMTMPHMTGEELARKVMEKRPHMPVILCSGHSELINREKALSMGIKAYCDKPLNMRELLTTVRDALGNR